MHALTNLPFSFATFTFHLTAREKIELPEYKGSTFRGGFGHALKQVWCLRPRGRVCEHCQNKTACAYSYIFETPRAFGKDTYMQAENLPHPFVLVPPLTKTRQIFPGESFSFGLNLFGSGIQLVESFIYAFDQLGEIGIGPGHKKFSLQKVTNADGSLVWSREQEPGEGQVRVNNFGSCSSTSTSSCSGSGTSTSIATATAAATATATITATAAVTLEFVTPTQILHQNRPVFDLNFEIFFRSLLRRASLLAEIHGGQKWELDYKQIISNACASVHATNRHFHRQDWERYSNRQERRMNIWGFAGRISFVGEIKPLLPLIKLGEHIHVGSKTSFGMGKYVVSGSR